MASFETVKKISAHVGPLGLFVDFLLQNQLSICRRLVKQQWQDKLYYLFAEASQTENDYPCPP